MRIPRRPEHSRSPASRRRILLAAVALLALSEGCGSPGHDGYFCTATCSGRTPLPYNWCLNRNLQDALDSAGCPAQTECKATADACDFSTLM
jgi:hypothetical protein